MYTARSRLLEQHPRIGHLLMAMLSQLQVVLRLVIVDLVVHKEVGRLALLDGAPGVTVGARDLAQAPPSRLPLIVSTYS